MRSTSEAGLKRTLARGRKPKLLEIGWREWVAIPSLGVGRIRAKIDTGAKISAIHAYRIREIEMDGVECVEFRIHPAEKRRTPEVLCRVPIKYRCTIRSSNGAAQERIVVTALLRMGGKAWPVDLSLANRDEMGFRLLIGRDALKQNVVIHPSRSYLLGR